MAKELWARCETCKIDFRVIPEPEWKFRVDQIIAGQSGGLLDLTCPKRHKLMLDASDKSKVFVKGK